MQRLLIAAAALATLAGATPAFADNPWCARTTTNGFNGDCSFASYRQCQATISGQGGDCIRNPRLAYGSMARPVHRHVRAYGYDDRGYGRDDYGPRGPVNAAGAGNNGNSFDGSNSLDNPNNFGNLR